MSRRLPMLTAAFASLIGLTGCQPLADGVGDATTDEALLLRLPTPPDVAWHFDYCLDAQHRAGLILAMLGLSQDSYTTGGVLQGAVGESYCINGVEKGGLFRANATGNHYQALQALNILPALETYSFSVSNYLVQTATASLWNQLPKSFDERGSLNANGPFFFVGYDAPPRSPGAVTYHIRDARTGGQLDLTNWIFPQSNCWRRSAQSWFQQWPRTSSNPLEQTVINATLAYLGPQGANQGHNEMFGPGGACDAMEAINTADAPSLAGWPMALDGDPIVDSRNNLVISGGAVIR